MVGGLMALGAGFAGGFVVGKSSYVPKPPPSPTLLVSTSPTPSSHPSQEPGSDSTKGTTPSPTASSKTVVRPSLMDTTGWRQVRVKKVRFKVPAEGEFKDTSDDGYHANPAIDGSAYYRLPESVTPSVSIIVRAFDGGSRRQWWIRELGASPSEVERYMRFQDVQLGSVQGLDVFADGGWWQGGYASPILIAQGTIVVAVHGGRGFHPETGEMTRYPLSDTVASTVEFTE